jgi:uncharacterized protein YjbI with pentapeptide repeats
MANEEQLSILKQGVEVWNKWRDENPEVEIDLSVSNLLGADLFGANLNNADLSGADLSGADLNRANLWKANLSAAHLREANLSGAHLAEAHLSRAHLTEAYLWEAHLSGADLSGADLWKANLSAAHLREANLREANLKGADLNRANLKEADLSGANLLEANFREAKLREADLSRADLRKANLWHANLGGADLWEANLSEANLIGANLELAHLREANLMRANLIGAKLRKANLWEANLLGANLKEADLREANLWHANLGGADLNRADLRKAHLSEASLIRTVVDKAKVSGSTIYGISVWDLNGKFEEERDLVISPPHAPIITVDNIKVAQFIYLILNNEEIRDVINTLTSKSVLILGRFALSERKAILDALRNRLREYDLLPIVFDFDRPTDKDFTETIKTLAGLSYFVIADITNPKSSPLELQATVPDYQIPFVPIIQEGESPFAMMVDLQKKYNWVLDTLSYSSIETLIKVLKPAIIDPAIQKHNELRLIKAREPKIRSANDFIENKGLDGPSN